MTTASSETVKSVVAMEVAERMLAEVASVDDARQLISMAETARVYARQSKLGTEAINHATVIKLRAERKLADIVDAGQQRGEIASPLSFHGNAHVERSESAPSTFEDLGLTKERVAEARILRDHYSDEAIAAKQAEANERDEILSRQRLIQEARQENERNGAVQRERVDRLFPVYEALAALASVQVSPSEWAKGVPVYSAHRVSDNLAAACRWINQLAEVWHEPTNNAK